MLDHRAKVATMPSEGVGVETGCAMVEIAAKNTAKNSFKNRIFDSARACKLGSIPRRSIRLAALAHGGPALRLTGFSWG
jgi:hypothetical protein